MKKKLLTILTLGSGFALMHPAAQAQTKLGNNPATIDPASILELEHPNKALYITRVALTSTTDVTTVPNPKAGMVVYNTNTAITTAPPYSLPVGGTGLYYFDGTAWISTGAGLPSTNYWNTTGNTGLNGATNFLGTTDNVPFALRTNNVQRILVRPDGTIALGNNVPIYPGNLVEIDLQNVGGALTNGEQNQGVNILASAINGTALSVGFRSRINIAPGNTGTGMRAIQGNANVEGTATGSVTAGYFDAAVKGTGKIGTNSIVTAIAGDAEASSGATADSTNTFIGGRTSANAANAVSARAMGLYGTANNSNRSDVGVFGAANGTGAQNFGLVAAQPVGFGAGVLGANAATGDNQYAGFFSSTNNTDNGRTVNINLAPAPGTMGASATGFKFPIAAEIGAQYNGTENTGSEAADLGAVHGLAATTSNDVQALGALLEGSSSGLNGNYTHAIGAFALATGNGTIGSPKSKIVGLAASLNFLGNSNVNGIAVNAYTAFNASTLGRAAAGHFDGTGAATEFGSISTVGDDSGYYHTFYDPRFTNMHIALAASNLNPAGANQLAIYSQGAVRMTGLTGAGTNMLTADGSGNIGTAPIPVASTAGSGLTQNGHQIDLGGTLTSNATVTGGNFITTFNSTNTVNQTAGFNVVAAPGAAITPGNEVFGTNVHLEGSDNQNPTVSGNETVLRGAVNYARATPGANNSNTRVQGSLNQGVASGVGLGSVKNIEQAIGTTGLGFYEGNAIGANADYLVGVLATTLNGGGGKISALSLDAGTSFGSFNSSVGGYFHPTGGTTSNQGVMSQIGGTKNDGWKDSYFAGKNVAVAAINYNPVSTTDLSLYTRGTVQMTSLGAATPVTVLGLDANGIVGTAAMPATVTADNGLTKTGNNIQLGGSLSKTGTTTITTASGKDLNVNGAGNLSYSGTGKVGFGTDAPINNVEVVATNVTGADKTTGQAFNVNATAGAGGSSSAIVGRMAQTAGNVTELRSVNGETIVANGVVTGGGAVKGNASGGVFASILTNGGELGDNGSTMTGVIGSTFIGGGTTHASNTVAGGVFSASGIGAATIPASSVGVLATAKSSSSNNIAMFAIANDDASTSSPGTIAAFIAASNPTTGIAGGGAAVVAINGTVGTNQRAIYSSGAVQMTGLTGTGTSMLTVDAAGLIGTAPAPASAATVAWGLTGNNNTTDGTNFLGTTNNVPLNFRVNNQSSGRLDANGNTFFGVQAAFNYPTPPPGSNFASNNTFLGYRSGFAFSTSSYNTGVGSFALRNTTGANNTALGYQAGQTNAGGQYNLALGFNADVASGGLNNAIAIGKNASVAASNAMALGGTGADAVKVGIGTSNPQRALHVTASALSTVRIDGLTDYPNNAAAITAGLVAGDLYRNGDFLMIVH